MNAENLKKLRIIKLFNLTLAGSYLYFFFELSVFENWLVLAALSTVFFGANAAASQIKARLEMEN